MGLSVGTALASLKIGKGLVGLFSKRKNKTPSFANSQLGLLLNKQSKQGTLSPLAQRNIVNKVSRGVNNSAANQKSLIRGNLIKKGFGNSIAGVRALNEPGLQASRIVSDTRKDVTTRNELSKVSAAQRFAELQFANQSNRTQERRGDFGEFINNTSEGIGDIIRGRSQEAASIEIDDLFDEYQKALSSGDIKKIEEIERRIALIRN